MSIHWIQGIIPPLVTPFLNDDQIDEKTHRAEVRHMVESAKVHGLAVCGSTGEGHTLSIDETRRLSSWTIDEVKGRVPVITGIIADSTRAAVERAKAVADLGVAALQVTPVHYVFRPDDDGMLRFFSTVSEKSGLPVIIYNVVPQSYLLPPLLVRILKEVDGVIGVKQSASDMKALADLLILSADAGIRDKVRILSAVDALLYPSFQIGSDGAVAAILTAVPEWCTELWEAVHAGNHARALHLHTHLLHLWNAIDAPNLPANVRTVMALRGRQGGQPRSPMPPSTPAQQARIKAVLEREAAAAGAHA